MTDRSFIPGGKDNITDQRIFRRTRSVDRNQGLSALRRITSMTLRYRGRVAVAFVATIVAALTQLAIPFLLGRALGPSKWVRSSARRSSRISIRKRLFGRGCG